MKTIIFIGTNKSCSSYEAIKASERMRYYTVLLTNRKSFIEKRQDFPYVHLMELCDIDNINEVRAAIDRLSESCLEIQAIVSFIDPYCHTAAVLSQEYGLKYFSQNAIGVMLDKIASREILKDSSYSPSFRVADGGKMPEMPDGMPLVLKSPMSSASRDVHIARTYRQYERAYKELTKKSPNTPILIEKFLEGSQFLVETLTVNGRVNVVAIIEQEITFTGRFIVTGYKMITDDGGEFLRTLKDAASSIIHTHGMLNGPCHLELRYSQGEWKLIEANPRIAGGAVNLFIETAYGVNLAKETLRFALGFEPELEHKYKKETFLQYVIVSKEGVLQKVTGKNMALDSHGVECVYIRPRKGSILLPPLSMGHRYAYVIATGSTAGEAKENAKTGASKIKFHLGRADVKAFNDTERSALREMKRDRNIIKALDNFSYNTVFDARIVK